ncbi:hypothetical protein [Streptomyces sp. enrichment culture]|uniref:hypothetical protein n=1 Tax=Streptomyces sp. enrichment culture TaxID=1795815 RepID=UPI003F5586F5
MAPNDLVIELLSEIHRLIAASPLPVAPALAGQVRRHAAEHGYTPKAGSDRCVSPLSMCWSWGYSACAPAIGAPRCRHSESRSSPR